MRVPPRIVFASLRALAPAALSVAVLAGCSSDSARLARVGDQTITVGDFRAVATQSWTRYPYAPDSAKARLLDDLVQRALLIEAARRSPRTIDSLVAAYRHGVETQVLTSALLQRIVPHDVPVSDAEIRRFYAWRDTATHAQLIYAPSGNAARAALQAIRGGEPFAAVESRYGMQGMLPPGGDVGFVVPGTLIDPLDRVIRTTPVGHVAGPVQAAGEGWFVLRVLDRRRQPQPPFAAESLAIRSMLTQRKQRVIWMAALESLRGQYHVTTDPKGISAMFHHYNTPSLIAQMGGEPPPPSPEELGAVLGRWDGGPGHRGAYTMQDAFDDLDAGRGERPNPAMMPALEQWVQGRITERVAVIEARRRHLDEEPEVARTLRETVNNYLVEGIYQSEVANRVVPSDADAQAAFEANAGAFTRLASARFQYLTFPDSAIAKTIYAKLRGARSLREAVLASSRGAQVREETVTYPTDDRLWSILEGTVRSAPAGTMLGPFHVPEGWRIVQIVAKDERRPRFEEIPPEMRQALVEQLGESLRERRLQAFTDSLRKAIPVTVDRARLARIAWPPRGAAMPQLAPSG